MTGLADEHLGIVLVDDDAPYRKVICEALRKSCSHEVFEAASGADLFSFLSSEVISCIVLEYAIGIDTGLELKMRVDEMYNKRIPVIMMTGDERQSTALRAFRMGIADYLPKRGLRAEVLARTIRDVVARHRLEQTAEAEHLRLVAASAVDQVTGLESFKSLQDRLQSLASLAPAFRGQYGLVLVRMVDFKGVLERFGFKLADSALRTLALRLSKVLSQSDVCARHVEGNFLILMNVKSSEATLSEICQQIASELSFRLTFDVAEVLLSVRVAGALTSVAPPGRGIDVDYHALISQLETALANDISAEGVTIIASKAMPSAVTTAPNFRSQDPARGAVPSERHRAADGLRAENRRRHFRQRVLKRGLIHIAGSVSTLNCTVRNLSLSGAGLRLEAACAVNEKFGLEIVGSGSRQPVQVRWQRGPDLGVEFIRSC